MSYHPEWSELNSLTSPSDVSDSKTPSLKYKQGVVLTEEQVESAMDDLNKRDILTKFPRVDKFYADPQHNNQVYCLHSFVPSKGATPDSKGVYGMIKCRGAFSSQQEANDRAESIIRNVDSFHSIYHSYVGRPFPLSRNPDYVKEVSEIDIRKDIVDTISSDIKKVKDEERKQIDEIKERERKLVEDTQKPEDPYDKYTTLRVKKAQVSWTYLESLKKLREMKTIILKTREEIAEMDTENEDYRNQYLDRYYSARKDAGLGMDDSFIKYLEVEADLDF
jgi:hypothetical protein